MEMLESHQVELSPGDEDIKEALKQIHEKWPKTFAQFEMGWRTSNVKFPRESLNILQVHGLVDEQGIIRPQVRKFLEQTLGEGIVD